MNLYHSTGTMHRTVENDQWESNKIKHFLQQYKAIGLLAEEGYNQQNLSSQLNVWNLLY